MRRRLLGNTGIEVSEVGFGAWQLGNAKDWGSTMTESEAVQLVHQAIDRGCNFFDTAPNYAEGNSETLLGKALFGKRNNTVITTKFGHPYGFGTDKLTLSVQESLQRLQTDYLDTLLLHNPPAGYYNGGHPIYEQLEKLKSEGVIRAYGVSLGSPENMFEVMRTTGSQVMEVYFNIFHQETAEAFPLAQERGVGIIANVPLDSGWFSGKYNAESQFTGGRSRWSRDEIERRSELLKKIRFLTEDGTSMVHAALRFILAYPQVSTTIPGIKNTAQLEQNLSASGTALSEEKVQRLREIWEREIKINPLPW